MASGHGVPKPNKAEHPNRKVQREMFSSGASPMPADTWYHMARPDGGGESGGTAGRSAPRLPVPKGPRTSAYA